MDLNLVQCNSEGILTFRIDEHIVTANVKYMRKWKCDTIDNSDSALVTTISNQVDYWGKLIHKGMKRAGK